MNVIEGKKDRIFNAVIVAILTLCVLICAYPLYLVVINSFSDPSLVAKGEVYLYPRA